jgi:hypothetical protein
VIKQRTNAVINLTSGGSPTMRVEERVKPGGVQAGGRKPQHGFDQLRPVPDAQPLQDVQIRLGAALSRSHERSHLP